MLSGAKTSGSAGSRVDHPDDVGGWLDIDAGVAYADSDLDGMPDVWEEKFGLDQLIDDSAEDADEDGYTNIEEFLNQTRPK